jgi:hypothetical protein
MRPPRTLRPHALADEDTTAIELDPGHGNQTMVNLVLTLAGPIPLRLNSKAPLCHGYFMGVAELRGIRHAGLSAGDSLRP